MFALTVEQLSHYEYQPSKKEQLKAAKKKMERELREKQGFESSSTSRCSSGRSSPCVVRRKSSRFSQIFGFGAATTTTRRVSGSSNGSDSNNNVGVKKQSDVCSITNGVWRPAPS